MEVVGGELAFDCAAKVFLWGVLGLPKVFQEIAAILVQLLLDFSNDLEYNKLSD